MSTLRALDQHIWTAEVALREYDVRSVRDDVRLLAPTQVFDDQQVVELGSMSVIRFHHLPGQTPDCCVGFVQERGLLLAGDSAETPFPVVPEGCQLDGWIAGLERWAAESRVRTVVPAHGAVGGREILQNNIRYLQGLRDRRPVEYELIIGEFEK